jgi:hypothetical protein
MSIEIKEPQRKVRFMGVEMYIPNNADYICIDYDGAVNTFSGSHPWSEPTFFEGSDQAEICVIKNNDHKDGFFPEWCNSVVSVSDLVN